MRTFVKWAARVVLSVAVLLVLVAVFLINRGGKIMATPVDVELAALDIPADSASIAHGEYLSRILACQECHQSGLEGALMVDAPPFRVVATNLTRVAEDYSSEDWDRAIRYGMAADGRSLLIMPSDLFNNVSDSEIEDLIAYLQTLEPAGEELPHTELKPLGKLIAGTGAPLAISHEIGKWGPRPEMPDFGPTAEFGKYRIKTICVACHGADLEGTQPPDPASPLGPSLASVRGWDLEGFVTTLRTGVTPGGKELDPYYMPWRAFANMTDEEMEAVYKGIMEW
ncbi:MAG: c-type cytochrome [Rhodothermales bacterium]|nr:c-type cytochrome [Rhodothermales bacterium]